MHVGTQEPIVWALALLVAIGGVGWVLWRLDVDPRESRRCLEERFVLGVPWGTLVVIAWLFAVYLFVQGGWWDWYRPVVVGFTAVDMFDPLAWFFAGFAHVSPSHLRGNVTSTLVFGPIVEWIWGHYPRGEDRTANPPWTRRPAVRAVVLFPLGIGSLAVVATLFSWGPVIGFSVAAYALVGIALVHHPVIAVVALVARDAVRLGYRAVTDPVQIAEATVRVVDPSWYGSAVQGHLVGMLLGVIVGVWLLDRRDHRRPSTAAVFGAATLVGASLSLWTVWWILGPDRYILFRAAGIMVVILVAVTIAAAAARDHADRLPRVAMAAIVIAVLIMGVVGVGLNLASVPSPQEEPAMSVEDYDIYYGEGATDGMVALVELEAFGLTTEVRTSGVIVVSEERNVWRQVISATELETHGAERIRVGGIGWSEDIVAVRRGWVPVGADPVYRVWVGDGDSFTPAFGSEAQTARPVVGGHNFTVQPAKEGFAVTVTNGEENATVPIPDDGHSVSALDVELRTEGEELVAYIDGSEVPIAERETYE